MLMKIVGLLLVGLVMMWAVIKIFWSKQKATEKIVENPTPPPEPQPEPIMSSSQVRFEIILSEETLSTLEQDKIITGTEDFAELVYHALSHYDTVIKLETEGRKICVLEPTGAVVTLESEQLQAARRFKTHKA